jgi:N-ethylmaleimide reductase
MTRSVRIHDAAQYARYGEVSLAAARSLVAFGRPYIANPDLVERFATGVPLAEVDWDTVYGSGPRGYSDYPTVHRAAAE